MKRSYIGVALGALIVVGAALSLPSCGHHQKLVSLEIQPATFTFLAPYPTGTEQYTAVGTYIQPPATMDVTNQATWKIDDGVVTMTTPGLFTPAKGYCGGGTISASVPEGTGGASNMVIGYATVTVDNPAVPLCPGYGTLATLSVGVVGTGTVTSSPPGISCPAVCIATFSVGASVLLTASPVTVAWGNCPGNSSNTCPVVIPAGGAAVTATFP